jgi:glutaredoxin-like protein
MYEVFMINENTEHSALIREEDKRFLTNQFRKKLSKTVTLIVFTSSDKKCMYCDKAVEIIEEVSSLSDKIRTVKYSFENDREMVEKYHVKKYPAIIVTSERIRDSRVVFYGLPSGYEFGSLVESIESASMDEPEIADKAKEIISGINMPVKITVYITPTCQYCPRASTIANKFAILNQNISYEITQILEFGDEDEIKDIEKVPYIKVNDRIIVIGTHTEEQFAEFVMGATKEQ